MGTRRQPLQRDQRARCTPELLQLFIRLLAIRDDPAQRDEYVAGEKQLCRALGLDFWSMQWATNVSAQSAYPPGHIQNQNWQAAWQWRQQLLRLCGLQADGTAAHQVAVKGD